MTQRPLNLRGSHHEFALILSREETLPESGGLRSPHVRPAGRARTVHNIEVDTTHAYYVATTGTWTLAHNGCTWDDAAGEWIDTETGKPRTPTRFSELVSSKGRINYDDVNRLAT